MDIVTKELEKRAENGLNVPGVRVELGKAHLWDVAVDHLAKELEIKL